MNLARSFWSARKKGGAGGSQGRICVRLQRFISVLIPTNAQVEVRGPASSHLARLGSVLLDAEGRTVGAVRGHGVSIQLGRST